VVIGLIRHELKFNIFKVVLAGLAFIGFAFLQQFFDKLIKNNSFSGDVAYVFSNINTMFIVSSVATLVIFSVIGIYQALYASIYGNEAHITHSLPISFRNIYMGKYLAALIYYLVGMFLLLTGVFVLSYNDNSVYLLKGSLKNNYGFLVMIFSNFIMYFNIFTVVLALIHCVRAKKYKILIIFIIYWIIGFSLSLIASLPMLIDLITPGKTGENLILLISGVWGFVISAALVFFSIKILEQQLSL
jgi:hypothetical protein